MTSSLVPNGNYKVWEDNSIRNVIELHIHDGTFSFAWGEDFAENVGETILSGVFEVEKYPLRDAAPRVIFTVTEDGEEKSFGAYAQIVADTGNNSLLFLARVYNTGRTDRIDEIYEAVDSQGNGALFRMVRV